MMTRGIVFLLLFSAALNANETQQPYVFANDTEQTRFYELTNKLRCVVCQNQTLLDSDAVLAKELRAQVYQMILAGKSDAEIIVYLTERYGDFILYQPPLQANTFLLWFGPLILLLIAAGVLGAIIWRAHKNYKVK